MSPRRATISRILIANRGEIARRIIRTAHRMGIETVAVFTEPDRKLPFVSEATLAIPLSTPESYLDAEAIIEAAKAAQADAIHPGYGFLSESAEFARRVRDAQLIFIGPSPEAIENLGSKTRAKTLAISVNVPTAPTLLFTTTDHSSMVDEITAFATTVGYPLLIKAAAGGGGRGMRILTEGSTIAVEVESAQREAMKAFGSNEVFVERFLSPARHVEVQIAADVYGKAVALGTRDCSLQRSNQKILEEAPAPNLLPGVEAKLFEAATTLAQASQYSNVGTVEFLYLADGSFYFLEVNTRLQVEHPVTEAVTGLDLVEKQIRLAEGLSLDELSIASSPSPLGHAIEARWCAEEYQDGRFVPATGLVLNLSVAQPHDCECTIRAEMGISAGAHVSHYYDSMLGKVIIHAPTRDRAIEALADTLARSYLSGVLTNRNLLVYLLSHDTFKRCRHTIQGSKELLPPFDLWSELEQEAHIAAAVLRTLASLSPWADSSPWTTTSFSHTPNVPSPFTTRGPYGAVISSQTIRSGSWMQVQMTHSLPTESTPAGEGAVLRVSTRDFCAHPDLTFTSMLSLSPGPPYSPIQITQRDREVWVHLPKGTVRLEVIAGPTRLTSGSEGIASLIKAHLPGKIVTLKVKVGDIVQEGEVVAVLDSMKMEHMLRAPCRGTLASVSTTEGAIVQTGAVLFEITPATGS